MQNNRFLYAVIFCFWIGACAFDLSGMIRLFLDDKFYGTMAANKCLFMALDVFLANVYYGDFMKWLKGDGEDFY